MKRLLLLLCISLFLAVPLQPAVAQTSGRAALLAQLQNLLQQLASLQAELDARQEEQVLGAISGRLDASKYYNGDYEAIYLLSGTTLRPYGNTVMSSEDQNIWNLVVEVFGADTIRDHFTEFRLYRDEDARFDAFVEQFDTGDWIVGVNLAGVSLEDPISREITIELLIHEYAHVLHHYEFETADAFTDAFWGRRSRDEDDYVSDYAMRNKEEDFAESFMYFVLNPRPSGYLDFHKKIEFFYEYDYFRDIREDIRDRLY